MGYMYQNDMQLAAMTRSMQEAAMKCVTMDAYDVDRDYSRTMQLQQAEIEELRAENRRLRMRIHLLKGGRFGDGSCI